MIIKFTIVSDEVEDFKRKIEIDADASFLDLNKAILKACNYTDDQITSFYICDKNWKQGTQIVREEMDDTLSSTEDIYIMEDTILRDMIEDINDHLVFVFDPLNERLFFIKVTDMVSGHASTPLCTLSTGKAPRERIRKAKALLRKSSDFAIKYSLRFWQSPSKTGSENER